MGPGPNDWDTSKLPELRRAYLDIGRSFESIANLIAADLKSQNIGPSLFATSQRVSPTLTRLASGCVLARKPSICFTMHPTVCAGDTGKAPILVFWQRDI
jgi:hypothetical protein